FLILIWTIILIQTHAADLLRHIASRCVGAPRVGLSRAGGGCGPREPVGVSLPWVHATEVTQNSPHHRLSRSCIAKRAKIVVEQWQIPSFVSALGPALREPSLVNLVASSRPAGAPHSMMSA